MCINAVVGSGVFLLPSESYKLLGPFSLWAPLLFAVPVFILVLCFAEASSHFSEPGGAVLYAEAALVDLPYDNTTPLSLKCAIPGVNVNIHQTTAPENQRPCKI